MSSFYQSTVETKLKSRAKKHPLLKIKAMVDWKPIHAYLKAQKGRHPLDNNGRPAYPVLPMFKAVLLGQWYNLSDAELENDLIDRNMFCYFCGFEDMETPDETTLCRFRNWLGQKNRLETLLDMLNGQLEDRGLKVKRGHYTMVDATLIETAGAIRRRAMEVEEGKGEGKGEGEDEGKGKGKGEGGDTVTVTVTLDPPSKDKDARWFKKGKDYTLGYKQHTRTDEEGYIEKIHTTPANKHEVNHLEVLLEGVEEGTTVYADKGYSSRSNRELLRARKLKDGIMEKAQRGKPLTREAIERNKAISKPRSTIEHTFATEKVKFGYRMASYFGLEKVRAQSLWKAMCVNLLKAANKIVAITTDVAMSAMAMGDMAMGAGERKLKGIGTRTSAVA